MSLDATKTLLACGMLSALAVGAASAQQADVPPAAEGPAIGSVLTPDSSRPVPRSAGKLAHTNFKVLVPRFRPAAGISPYGGNFYETPASLACVYRQVPVARGCVPHRARIVAGGGSHTIALVDAYDHPNIAGNLATYSAQFGLPPANFRIVFAGGARPAQDPTGGWEMEEALDVEMAHALAPYANILLVEADSNSVTDLLKAVDVASAIVARAGGGEVSMSFGSDEFSGQDGYDAHFLKPGVVYFASTGDDPGVEWPSTSAAVVAVGGTSISRNLTTGIFYGETTWSEGGGGPSAYVPAQAFQDPVKVYTGGTRSVPDIAAVANPYTGVLVFDYIPGSASATGWMVLGGTSVSSPLVAALANASGIFRGSSAEELATLYARIGTGGFKAIVNGSCGPDGGYSPTLPWSPCVGLGSPARNSPF